MNYNDDNDYVIIAKPSLTYVIQGKEISFELVKINPSLPDVDKLEVSWECLINTNDPAGRTNTMDGPIGPKWEGFSLESIGEQTIVCHVRYLSLGMDRYYQYVQRLISVEECLSYDPGSYEESNNPFNILHNLKKMIDSIRSIEKSSILPENETKLYEERMENMETYRDKLEYLLNKIPASHKEKFCFARARHYSSDYPSTNSIPIQVCYFYANNKGYLLDWTSPVTQGWCGVFEGDGETEDIAISQAIKQWKNDNRYPKGILKIQYHFKVHPTIEIPKYNAQGKIEYESHNYSYTKEGEFNTSGKTFWDKVSHWLVVGAVILFAVVLVFVPGGQIGSIILSGIAAGMIATSSVISIAQRKKTGFSNWKEDGLDALTIVACLLGVGSVAGLIKWGPIEFLTASGQVSKANTLKVLLYGQVISNTSLGIAVEYELMTQIIAVANDKTIPADKKIEQITQLITLGAATGVLTFFSVKITAKELGLIQKESQILPNFNSENGNIKRLPESESIKLRNDKNIIELDSDGNVILPKQTPEIARIGFQIDDNGSIHWNSLSEPPKLLLTENINANGAITGLNVSQQTAWQHLEMTGFFISKTNNINVLYPNKNYVRYFPNIAKAIATQQETKMIDNLFLKQIAPDYFLEGISGKLEYIPWQKQGYGVLSRTTVIESNNADRVVSNIQKLKESALTQVVDKNVWAKRTAISRATCEIEGIHFENANDFYNLAFGLKEAKSIGLVRVTTLDEVETAKTLGVIVDRPDELVRVTDIDKYIATLENKYLKSSKLYMNTQTKQLIKTYLVKQDGYFNRWYGMPGAHAEVLAVNDVYNQLEAKGLNPSDYQSKIEVYTLNTQHPDGNFLYEFCACPNCSGILDYRNIIHTGRQ